MPEDGEPLETIQVNAGNRLIFTWDEGRSDVALHLSGSCEDQTGAIDLGNRSPVEYVVPAGLGSAVGTPQLFVSQRNCEEDGGLQMTVIVYDEDVEFTPGPTDAPTMIPSDMPSNLPTQSSESPTSLPSASPSAAPSDAPSDVPSSSPSASPSESPTITSTPIQWFVPEDGGPLPPLNVTVGEAVQFIWEEGERHSIFTHLAFDCEQEGSVFVADEPGTLFRFTEFDLGQVYFADQERRNCNDGALMVVNVFPADTLAPTIMVVTESPSASPSSSPVDASMPVDEGTAAPTPSDNATPAPTEESPPTDGESEAPTETPTDAGVSLGVGRCSSVAAVVFTSIFFLL